MNNTALMVVERRAIEETATNSAPHGAADLDKLREEIDELDAEILRLTRKSRRDGGGQYPAERGAEPGWGGGAVPAGLGVRLRVRG